MGAFPKVTKRMPKLVEEARRWTERFLAFTVSSVEVGVFSAARGSLTARDKRVRECASCASVCEQPFFGRVGGSSLLPAGDGLGGPSRVKGLSVVIVVGEAAASSAAGARAGPFFEVTGSAGERVLSDDSERRRVPGLRGCPAEIREGGREYDESALFGGLAESVEADGVSLWASPGHGLYGGRRGARRGWRSWGGAGTGRWGRRRWSAWTSAWSGGRVGWNGRGMIAGCRRL